MKLAKLLIASIFLAFSASLSVAQEAVGNFVFAMPPQWIVVPVQVTENDNLQFRRFSVVMHKADFDAAKAGQLDHPQLIGPPGTFINSMIYNCAHDPQRFDFLTFHLPEQVGPTSFARGDWVSKMEVRILADGRSLRFQGEYVKGDLFIDASANRIADGFDRILSSQEVALEFGDARDRLNLFVGDNVGKATVGPFIREVLPSVLGVRRDTYLGTTAMLARCSAFKQSKG